MAVAARIATKWGRKNNDCLFSNAARRGATDSICFAGHRHPLDRAPGGTGSRAARLKVPWRVAYWTPSPVDTAPTFPSGSFFGNRLAALRANATHIASQIVTPRLAHPAQRFAPLCEPAFQRPRRNPGEGGTSKEQDCSGPVPMPHGTRPPRCRPRRKSTTLFAVASSGILSYEGRPAW